MTSSPTGFPTASPTVFNCPQASGKNNVKCQEYKSFVRNYKFNDAASIMRVSSDYRLIGAEMIIRDTCLDETVNGLGETIKYYYYTDKSFPTEGVTFLTLLILIAFLIINCRTCHPYTTDFYRAINYYIGGTLAFGLFLAAFGGIGFTRPVAIGVLLHNTAEFFILKRLWFGNYGVGITILWVGAIYQIFMLVSIFTMDIMYLYLLAMWQGATMDFALVQTYILVAIQYRNLKGSWNWNFKAWLVGFFAAFVHISTIIPMFFGLIVGNRNLTFSATAGLAATFLLYELYLAFRYGRINCCKPSYSSQLKLALNLSSDIKMNKKFELLGAIDNIGSAGGDTLIEINALVDQKKLLRQQKKQNNQSPNENQDETKDDIELDEIKKEPENPDEDSNLSVLEKITNFYKPVHLDVKNGLFKDISAYNVQQENILAQAGIAMVFYKMGPMESPCNCKKFGIFWIVTAIAFCVAGGFSLWVWFSPTMFNNRCLE